MCVPDLIFEDYLGYARSEPGFTNPPAWAMKHFPLRDADPLVREWKQRRELTLEGRPPLEEKLTPFHAAAQKSKRLLPPSRAHDRVKRRIPPGRRHDLPRAEI